MYLSEFWSKFGKDIILSSIFIVISVVLLVLLIINLGANNTSKKLRIIGGSIFGFVLVGVNYALLRDFNKTKLNNPDLAFPLAKILLFNAFVILIFVLIGYLFVYRKEKTHEKTSVSSVSSLALMVALASVLQIFGIPLIPGASFLKVEISALIYFMVLLWFGIKPTIAVVVLTNIIHVIMPSFTPPVVFGLDESANIVACLIFLTPSFIAFRKLPKNQMPEFKKVVFTSILGVLCTMTFMVLYNHFLFIPLYRNILGISMESLEFYGVELKLNFVGILIIFGFFNLVKWGLVSTVVILLYRRLYGLKHQLMRN
jgi:riboflavin transporter FmnP